MGDGMDRFTIGFFGGLAAGVVVGIIAMVMNMAGLCRLCLIALGGGVFQKELLQGTPSVGWIVLGWIGHLIISATLGVAIAVLLTYTGKKLAVLKGIFLAVATWYLLIGIFAPLAGYLPESPQWAELLLVLGYHVLFGGLTAYLITRYGSTEKVT